MVNEAEDLMARVRRAQSELGSGSIDEALALVTPLLDVTAEEIAAPEYLTRSPRGRALVVEAFCYARVTAILALESVGAREAVPTIRRLAAEAREIAGAGTDGWRVQSAAAEMLSRCGDGQGAVEAVVAAEALAPPDEPYVDRLRSSIRSMFPGIGDTDSRT